MDYEQKYNAALKIAEEVYHDHRNDRDWRDLLTELFPELKEPKEEQIRKKLIKAFGSMVKEQWGGIAIEDILAWLEKQGEQKPYGQRKECEDCQFNYVGECKGYCQMKRGEQKPADEVEPKFHKGEWIISDTASKDYHICKITGIKDGNYTIESTRGYKGYNQFDVFDTAYRLWTIQDAKDGDVLFHSDSASNGIFVFKEILQCGTIQKVLCYCDYDSKDGFCLGENHTCCWTNNKILHPATKEQCDMLFHKMREAGFEWNAEKKTLNTIEQKPIDNVEPKFHEGDWIINQEGKRYRIKSIYNVDDGYYIATDKDGEDNRICFSIANEYFHLWTINDAKDGDVLVDVYGNIGIFDKCYDFDWMSSCSLGKNRGFQHFTVEHENEKTHPATKEQRDLFFSKMKEAGYE